MGQVPEAYWPYLSAFLDADLAWSSADRIAEALGHTPEIAYALVAELYSAGLIDLWACEPVPLYRLAPEGAELVGARLLQAAGGEVLRWSDDCITIRSRRRSRRASSRWLESVADPQPTAPEWAAAEEEFIRRWRPRVIDDLPWPRIFLEGPSLIPWDERGRRDNPFDRSQRPESAEEYLDRCGGCCAACRGMQLGPSTVCGRCYRWSSDRLFSRKKGGGRQAG